MLHHGIAIRPGVVLFGGGLPIVEDGAVIGAIGVSGGSEDDDRAAAAAGAAEAALGGGVTHPRYRGIGINIDIKKNIDKTDKNAI